MKLHVVKAGEDAIGYFHETKGAEESVQILNSGIIGAELPKDMGWAEARAWGRALLMLSYTAEARGYAETRDAQTRLEAKVEAGEICRLCGRNASDSK